MLAEERLSRIMKLLSQQRTATVQELCEALDASESTIRRDLNELDRMGKVNSRPLIPRKRLSRPRSCAGREKPGSSWMTRSSPASTRRSSPSCPAARS